LLAWENLADGRNAQLQIMSAENDRIGRMAILHFLAKADGFPPPVGDAKKSIGSEKE
jgi:hypothetical protein